MLENVNRDWAEIPVKTEIEAKKAYPIYVSPFYLIPREGYKQTLVSTYLLNNTVRTQMPTYDPKLAKHPKLVTPLVTTRN